MPPLLFDECMGSTSVATFRSVGHDVLYIRETQPGSSDEEVVAVANFGERVLVTEDKGLAERIFRGEAAVRAVVLVRMAIVDPNRKAQRLLQALESHSDRLDGHMIVVEDATMRIRPFLRAV